MNIKNLLILCIIAMVGFSSCLKEDTFDYEKQAATDDAIIVKFLADNNIPAVKHSSGVYYQVIQQGSGNEMYTANTQITAHYVGRLISGTEFERSGANPLNFNLGNVIVGWQIGIQQIQEGGKIRLFIPSGYAYGPQGSGPIPGNSVLDFDIELVDVRN